MAIDERTVNQIGEISYAAGIARGIREGIELMLKHGYSDQQVSKIGTSCLELALILENVADDMMGEAE